MTKFDSLDAKGVYDVLLEIEKQLNNYVNNGYSNYSAVGEGFSHSHDISGKLANTTTFIENANKGVYSDADASKIIEKACCVQHEITRYIRKQSFK
ncbi:MULTISPECIES: hypothetical protein [Staphylococcus]|jgi:hypothetical protein|uniref:hypothetical protein n=1 Tax=Staphylococcus TaxID=1279 RepID=UPI00026BFBF6|nr:MULTISPECIES: hypothetical protein [Staphylococcus]EJE28463.1 hypothetical protein HMPREF9973_12805 [Staphylococcus epidermidis NIH05001]MBM6053323.1 hypothetical protein [Staphylococcus epidermidis]MCG1178785.1 hypothetical protein [Staphylococcus epidermidis]MCG2073935.1 hypothetical protein [Staphylococcus epidermidis]MCG2245608.1 hypothetical protein [Staphylococcus epidermidis]